MHRRSFLTRSGLALFALAMGGMTFLTGCSWETDLLNWLPLGIQSINTILSLLAGAGILLGPSILATIGVIQAGLEDLRLAVIEYQATNPPPVGLLAKIDTLLSDLVANIGNVISQLPANNIISLVIGLFELVLSMLEGFLQRATPTSLPKTAVALKRAIVVQGKSVVVFPRTNLSRRKYIRDFNHLLDAGGHSEDDLHESLVQKL